MKWMFTLGLGLIYTLLSAQAPPDFSSQCKAQMKKLSAFIGQWEGEATYRRGPGPVQTIVQTENVELRIDSTVLVIEGKGTLLNKNEVVFNALGIINFNPYSRSFSFKSYLKDGRSTEAYFIVLNDNSFEWGFDIPGGAGKVRYRITLNDNGRTWVEHGEFSNDGTEWMKFIEMRLAKKG